MLNFSKTNHRLNYQIQEGKTVVEMAKNLILATFAPSFDPLVSMTQERWQTGEIQNISLRNHIFMGMYKAYKLMEGYNYNDHKY